MEKYSMKDRSTTLIWQTEGVLSARCKMLIQPIKHMRIMYQGDKNWTSYSYLMGQR